MLKVILLEICYKTYEKSLRKSRDSFTRIKSIKLKVIKIGYLKNRRP